MKNEHRDGPGMETDSDFKIRVIPHSEVERGVDEALIEGGQGRSAGDLAHDAAVIGLSLILAAVVIALAVFA